MRPRPPGTPGGSRTSPRRVPVRRPNSDTSSPMSAARASAITASSAAVRNQNVGQMSRLGARDRRRRSRSPACRHAAAATPYATTRSQLESTQLLITARTVSGPDPGSADCDVHGTCPRRDHGPPRRATSISCARVGVERFPDVPQMVDRVVQQVPGERVDGEHRAIAAFARARPLVVADTVEPGGEHLGRLDELATPRSPDPARRSGRRSPSRPGPSWRTWDAPRPASATGGRRTRGTRRGRDIRTRAATRPTATAGHAPSDAGAPRPTPRSSHESSRRPARGRPAARRSRIPGTRARAPTSSSCRRERSSSRPR